MDRKTRIYNETVRLGALFWEMPKDQFFMVLGLIEQAAFLRIALDDMQKEVASTGAVEEYQNGEHQSGQKISSVLTAYNKTLQTYQKVVKQLEEMRPKTNRYRQPGESEHELIAFRRFKEMERIDYYLSDDFKQLLDESREKAIELMLQGN